MIVVIASLLPVAIWAACLGCRWLHTLCVVSKQRRVLSLIDDGGDAIAIASIGYGQHWRKIEVCGSQRLCNDCKGYWLMMDMCDWWDLHGDDNRAWGKGTSMSDRLWTTIDERWLHYLIKQYWPSVKTNWSRTWVPWKGDVS